jgi:hypothetical protein
MGGAVIGLFRNRFTMPIGTESGTEADDGMLTTGGKRCGVIRIEK